MGVYPKNSKGPEGPMVQEINEEMAPIHFVNNVPNSVVEF